MRETESAVAVRRDWARIAPNIRTFNLDPRARAHLSDLVRDVPMEVKLVRDAFVSRREVVNSADGVKFARTSDWYSLGAVYESGQLLPEFTQRAGYYPGKFRDPPAMEGARIAAAEIIEDPAIYMGPLHGHFGHFLLESLGRAWALRDHGRGLKVVFHFANFAGGDLTPSVLEKRLPPFVLNSLATLGVGLEQVILANRDLRFRRLLLPTNQLWLMLYCGPGAMAVYDHIRESLGPARTQGPRRIYLTRRRLDLGDGRKTPKSIGNEEEIERLFLARGFEIVAPETLSLLDQARLIAGATHMAGSTGSAMHMAVFNNRPETRVISLDWRDVRSQYMIEAARGCEAAHISCLAGLDARGARVLDVDMIDRALGDLRI